MRNPFRKFGISPFSLTLCGCVVVLFVACALNTWRVYRIEHERLVALGTSEIQVASQRLDRTLRRMATVVETETLEVEDFLAAESRSHQACEAFLQRRTRRLRTALDDACQELYLAREGWYAGGIGWTPTPDFVPERRPWFRLALAAHGRVVIQPPYESANNSGTLITVTRLLSDGKTILALDVNLAQFEPMARVELDEAKAYIFFLSPDGTVVARAGGEVSQIDVGLVRRVLEIRDGSFLHRTSRGANCIFSRCVFGDWRTVVAVDLARFAAPIRTTLFVQGALMLLICAVALFISIFVHRTRRVREAAEAANAAVVEKALHALQSRTSLASFTDFLSIVRERFDCSCSYLVHFDAKTQRASIATGHCVFHDGTVNAAQYTRDLGADEHLLVDLVANGCFELGRNVCEDMRDSAPRGLVANYGLAVPVVVSGRLWGTMVVAFAAPRAFDRSERDLLDRVAEVLGSAIERRDTYEEVLRANSDLRAALSAAKAGERAKTRFLATMSHEIRTPLNAVVGFAEFLRAPECSEADRREYTEGILTSSTALLALINDVLDLSKIEAGKMEMRGGACNLRALFEEIETVFRFSVAQKKLELRHDLAPDFPVLALREERIRQILLNLVGNAVKFTERGQVSYAASLEGEELVIRVSDTGPGIAPDRLESIFDPFVQDGGVRGGRVYQGTGLGLPICRRLAESEGGALTVASRPGAGSTFTLRLPRVGIVSSAVALAPPPAQKTVPVIVDDRLYLVDDVALNLRVAARHVELLGVRKENVRTFLRADEALAALRADVSKEGGRMVVLTDMWMPEMDGTELARIVRADPALRNISVVALTADADAASSFDVSVFDDILTKPLTGEKLRQLFVRLGTCPKGSFVR